MNEISEFVQRTNEIYKDEGLWIDFSKSDNSYTVYTDSKTLAIFKEDRSIELFENNIDVTLVYLLNLIDFSGEFL